MYKVIKYFTDLQDGNREYNVGDVFPSPEAAYEVTQERYDELASDTNQQGRQLIEKEDEKELLHVDNTPSTYDDYTVDELKDLAKERELVGYSKMNRSQLIKLLTK